MSYPFGFEGFCRYEATKETQLEFIVGVWLLDPKGSLRLDITQVKLSWHGLETLESFGPYLVVLAWPRPEQHATAIGKG